MKKVILSFLLASLSTALLAQNQAEITADSEHEGGRIVKGIITAEWLLKDSVFNKDYTGRPPGYTPDAQALDILRRKGDSIQLFVFMGTWCEDSRFVVPRLFFLLDAAGYSKQKLTIVGVDRSKQTLGNLTQTLSVKNVPTIIAFKNGKELGRVVEYGKSGLFDKDLGEVLTPKQGGQ